MFDGEALKSNLPSGPSPLASNFCASRTQIDRAGNEPIQGEPSSIRSLTYFRVLWRAREAKTREDRREIQSRALRLPPQPPGMARQPLPVALPQSNAFHQRNVRLTRDGGGGITNDYIFRGITQSSRVRAGDTSLHLGTNFTDP